MREKVDSGPIDVKWTDELRIYGEGFVGRQEELAALDRAWAEGVRIFALHAEGGAGKTRVVVEWLRRIRDDGWRGARRVFVHSFHQGNDERRDASSELFFEQALAYFGYRGEPITEADERGRTLARLLVEHPGLLVLDGLEPLQHPVQHAERGRLKDPGIARLLLTLANVPHEETRGLCLITSRQPVVELKERTGATVVLQSLDQLHRDDGADLLRQLEVAGPAEELRKASDEFHGHAYSLMLLGSYLKNATEHHDIRLRREVVLLEEDAQYGDYAQKMFTAYVTHLGEDSPEVAVLRLFGFFDRAAERQLLDVLRAREAVAYEWPQVRRRRRRDVQPQPKPIEASLGEVTAPLLDLSQSQWNRVLSRLRDLGLIAFTGPGTSPAVNAHPLLRACFARQVQEQFPDAWQAGHRRLFEHLSGSVPYWPEGIEGLLPLYQAVTHGCLAGLHQLVCIDVYLKRILRGADEYSSRRLGAISAELGAVACFFTRPWTTLAPGLTDGDQAWLFNTAAIYLKAVGRLTEAVEPFQLSLRINIAAKKREPAAVTANNLSDLELTRGELSKAIAVGEKSVQHADEAEKSAQHADENEKIRIKFQQIVCRSTLADALYQAGRRNEARLLFEDAELRQIDFQPHYPRLHSVQGFPYCDFLLADAERVAWQCWLAGDAGPCEAPTISRSACDAVGQRALQSLEWTVGKVGLLSIALDRLTVARALLYKTPFAASIPPSALDDVTAAIDGFHQAGQVHVLPSGLLTRAWIRCLSRDETGCRADLDEARGIAERGPMPLFQADIQLYRARLFRDRAALAEARRLIEKHGYHRRHGELADALAAAERW